MNQRDPFHLHPGAWPSKRAEVFVWTWRDTFALAGFLILVALGLIGACGCSSDFGAVGELAQELSADEPACTLEGTYLVTLVPLPEEPCQYWGGYIERHEDAPQACSWRFNGEQGRVDCEPGAPVKHCVGEAFEERTQCWREVRLERVQGRP